MRKLEDIPKNNPFSVPDGYFDKLPGVIQARIDAGRVKKPVPYLRYALQYAMPVVALIIVAVFYFRPQAAAESYNDLLASVSSEQLVAYLADSDITTDDLVDAGTLDEESAEAIEAEVFTDIDFDDINELDLDL
ncbi:MAG TPA: hypothetical protein PK325_05995 [Cyclobacteriaceae bacterium]|nr:hypothetical protein [Cyclobacteriaceae bacterium]HMV10409.1 hypothetical protein [Cyclobacteriaceae bacterium]HMV90784.1 hypothetical protein [Cyclobacteriaceae bacterium]HMX00434.1 hypothetical protein [Cyclobacteriaceae bacterium]HMX50482.1 hypothetical protein [Cyclobacteriaceae bacterium]